MQPGDSALSFDAVTELFALDGTDGFAIPGLAARDYSGGSVASAGDVNGDGIDDLIIGARGADPNGSASGVSYVVFGRADGFGASFDLATLYGSNGFRVSGAEAFDQSGYAVASAGDVNGDGIDDLMIGAWRADPNGSDSGASYVVFGRDTATVGDFEANLNLSTLNGTNGFRISGVAGGDFSGRSVASAGDVNGDGIDDLIIGAYGADPNGGASGISYVVFGRDTASVGDFDANLDLSTLGGLNGFQLNGAATLDRSGWSVAAAGDVNGDSFDDLIIGAFGADTNGSYSGDSYVVFGRNTASVGAFAASIDLSTLDGSDGFRISGETEFDRSGIVVSSAGDINGDGVGDMIVGASGANPHYDYSGASYVVFGRDTASAGAFAASLNLSTLNGTNGFRISGAAAYDQSGWSVASAGDLNGDGFDDLIVGAVGAYHDLEFDSGATYVVFGRGTGFAAELDVSTLDGSNGFRVNGVALNDHSGVSVASAGDVNGDGVDDLIIGARDADPNGDYSGASYVVFGRASAVVDQGTAGDDTSNGAAGSDQLSGQNGEDILSGLNGDDLLDGGDGDDALYGGAGLDDLVGGLGGDLLDGGTGADAMAGGVGSDTYIVDDIGDVTTELGGEGSDRVRASVTYTLGANLENLTLEGAGDIDGTGNGLANVLDGNGGANSLAGGGGNDLIKGGAGDDILNGGTGVDQLLGGIGEDDLDGAEDNDRLEGGDGNDTILGGTGADILDGGADNDTLTGGNGADQLLGGAGIDTLDGGEGNDSLNGGVGADAMTGGLGDDIFFVDDAGDTTIEESSQGNDQVRATISHILAANIETLTLQGVGNLNGTGNGLANTLNGNPGNNTLDGAAGNDLLKGGDGSDTLIGGTGNDILAGGAGGDAFAVRQASVYSSLDPGGRVLEVDTVSDFSTAGGDYLDLSAIDAIAGGADDAFVLVGAFSGAAGQMTLTFGGGTTTLRLDTDGDGAADYLMKINGNVTADSGGWLL
jgi:Ca2+-binding RTX toxin-like protein